MIYCFTDFGTEGPYMGQMKARIAHLVPNEPILDLMLDVPAFDVRAASFLLAALVKDMPEGGIYLCVVDPGVGSSRKPIIVECDGRIFVGPDNGLFQSVIEEAKEAKAYEILWRPEKLSNSFHGRDLFAPVCALLVSGQAFDKAERSLGSLVSYEQRNEAQIIYIDSYGNCWTNIYGDDIGEKHILSVNQNVFHYAPVFSAVEAGQSFWYVNSSGLVEFAMNCENASQVLDIKIGAKVLMENAS